MTPQEIYDDALTLVNVMRARLGKEPLTALPKGVPGDGAQCPIRRALGDSCTMVDGSWIRFNNYDDAETFHAEDELKMSTPPAFGIFLAEFDEGKFPDLVDNEYMRTHTYEEEGDE